MRRRRDDDAANAATKRETGTTGKPHLWLRVVVPEVGAIGPGKINLLKAIDREHSIAAAARAMGMSYRRAWLLVEDTQKVAGRELVATRAGGADRGGATLTEAGHELVRTYERICAAANRAAAAEIARILVPAGKAQD
jgi:molybdate transport system regulatory protein